MSQRTALVAFGGNALVERGGEATERAQIRHADRLARELVRVVDSGCRLLLVHGNGPQVGDALIRVEAAARRVPPLTLDVCVAESQGSIGFFLERALRDALRRRRVRPDPVTVLTQVLVSRSDPRFRRPTKPIGPYYPPARARELERRWGWRMTFEPGLGHRRIVASPRPQDVLGVSAVRDLLAGGHIVIAGGGGGIPVVRTRRGLRGVEAVVDKDLTAFLLASRLGVDLFVILTNVDGVYEGWGTPRARRLPRLTLARARAGLQAGEFPSGSMGPKVEAAVRFVEETGREVIITDAPRFARAVAGRAGTRVVPDEATTRLAEGG
jgi:carbamate kinase